MNVKGLRWVGICSSNVGASVDFYTTVLGLAVKRRGTLPANASDSEYVELRLLNGDCVELFDCNLPERELFAGPVIGFEVEDVAAARTEMEDRGVEFLRPTAVATNCAWAYFRTPDGHVCQLMSVRKQQ